MTTYPDRNHAPALGHAQILNIQEPESFTLDNGIPVFLLPANQQEATRLDIVFDAGSSFQTQKLQASAVNKLLKEGTRNKSSYEITKTLDFYGAYLEPFSGKDKAGITLFGLYKYFDKLLPLIFEIISEAVFPEEEVRLYAERKKQQFTIQYQKVRYRASMEYNELIFGKNTAYGQKLEENDFDILCRDLLVDFYQLHYQPHNTYFLLGGKTSPELFKQLNDTLGKIPGNGQPFLSEPKVYWTQDEEQYRYVTKENALQSALRIGNITLERSHPDYPKLYLLNTILGGYFGSRLMSSLREDKGYTYGVYSSIENFKHGNSLTIATEVNAEHTVAALIEIEHQVELLSQHKIPDRELETVKNYLQGSFLRYFDGPFSLADQFLKSHSLGLNFVHYKEMLEQVMDLTTGELLDAARKYMDFKKMKVLVAGKTDELK
ncbi:MAG: insulinase family protein [Bacteroidales bacterium]|nr:insulinase family protein [Bacteroidales bacterium]